MTIFYLEEFVGRFAAIGRVIFPFGIFFFCLLYKGEMNGGEFSAAIELPYADPEGGCGIDAEQ